MNVFEWKNILSPNVQKRKERQKCSLFQYTRLSTAPSVTLEKERNQPCYSVTKLPEIELAFMLLWEELLIFSYKFHSCENYAEKQISFSFLLKCDYVCYMLIGKV